jgi:hypothetical protein
VIDGASAAGPGAEGDVTPGEGTESSQRQSLATANVSGKLATVGPQGSKPVIVAASDGTSGGPWEGRGVGAGVGGEDEVIGGGNLCSPPAVGPGRKILVRALWLPGSRQGSSQDRFRESQAGHRSISMRKSGFILPILNKLVDMTQKETIDCYIGWNDKFERQACLLEHIDLFNSSVWIYSRVGPVDIRGDRGFWGVECYFQRGPPRFLVGTNESWKIIFDGLLEKNQGVIKKKARGAGCRWVSVREGQAIAGIVTVL